MKDQEHPSKKFFNLIEKQIILFRSKVELRNSGFQLLFLFLMVAIQITFKSESGGQHYLQQSYSKNWVDDYDEDYIVF